MKNDKTIMIRINQELYSKLKAMPNQSLFIRTAIEERLNRGDREVGDFTYMTRIEALELIRKELEDFGIKRIKKPELEF